MIETVPDTNPYITTTEIFGNELMREARKRDQGLRGQTVHEPDSLVAKGAY